VTTEKPTCGLLIKAVHYWHAARIVLQSQELARPIILYAPISYMLCLSAELALKHYLLQQGMLETDFKKVGNHDLVALFAKAREKGLILQIDDGQALIVMKQAHSGSVSAFRYSFAGNLPFVDPESMLATVARVIDVVSGNPDVLRRGYGRNNSDLCWSNQLGKGTENPQEEAGAS
jgi:hypothetical protein